MFGDILKAVGTVVGTVTGSIIGISATVVAEALGITLEMAKEAIDSGCTTYQEVKNFHKQ